MNDINFLNSFSEQKYCSFLKWLKISTLLFISLVLSICIIQFKQIYKLTLLKKQKTELEQSVVNFDDFVKEKTKITQYKNDLEKQLKKLEKISSSTQKELIFNFLTELIKIVPEELFLLNFEFDSKNGIILKGYSIQINTINEFIQNLNKLYLIDNAKLERLEFKEKLNSDTDEMEQKNTTHEFLIKVKLKKIG